LKINTTHTVETLLRTSMELDKWPD